MKILKAKVKDYDQFDNLPTLEILVDKIPDNDSLIYEQKGSSYFAEKDGFVSFFYYNEPGRGYGGRIFTINTKDGKKDLIGPWSSNSKAMKDSGFMDSVGVSITDDPKVMEKGFTFFAGHITYELFVETCNSIKCSVGKDKYDFYNPMPYCKCSFPYTQKYRIDLPLKEGEKFPKMIRKIACKKCIKEYNLNCNPISSEVVYE